jgi:hypothetical protein
MSFDYSEDLTGNSYLMVSQKLSEARFLDKSFLKEVWRKLFLEKVSSKKTPQNNKKGPLRLTAGSNDGCQTFKGP